MLNGSQFNLAPNFYHKPIASLNWDWTINDALKLSTVVYASWGRGGGGTGLNGTIKNANNQTMNFMNYGPVAMVQLTGIRSTVTTEEVW